MKPCFSVSGRAHEGSALRLKLVAREPDFQRFLVATRCSATHWQYQWQLPVTAGGHRSRAK